MRCYRTASVGALLCLTACAVQTQDGVRLAVTSPEFPGYVERVFREQNRVADELAFALDDDASARLDGVEENLLAACRQLNELATTRRDNVEISVRRRLAAARSAPACERATASAEEALAAVRKREPGALERE